MGVFGKILGGIGGGLLGGPAGALAGYTIAGDVIPFKRGGRVKRRSPPRTKSGRFRKRK